MSKYLLAVLLLLTIMGCCSERTIIDLNCEKGEVYYKWYHAEGLIGYPPSKEETRNRLRAQGFYTNDDGKRMECK